MPDLNDSQLASGRILDNVDWIEKPQYIQFDPLSEPLSAEGRLIWNPSEGTLEIGLEGGNVNLPIGAKNVIYVKNGTVNTIPKGSGVMATGAAGDRITVAPAVADGSVSARFMLGVTAEDITTEGFGFVVTNGYVRNVNTNSYLIGTVLYFDPDTPGALTSTEPQSPDIELPIAIVTKQNAAAGILYIRMVNNLYIHEIHDVLINTATSGDILVYDGTLWVNQQPSSGSVSVSDTPPSSPSVGDIWFESDTAKTYVYYDSYWVEIGATSVDVVLNTVDAKGDLLVGTADNTVGKLTAGTNEHRLVADSAVTAGLKYVADTTNYAVAAKGDLLVGTAADTVAALPVGTNGHVLTAASGETTGVRWAAVPPGGLILLVTNAFTGTSGFSLPNASFGNTYANYRLVIRVTSHAANLDADYTGRMRSSGTDSTANDYQYAFAGHDSAGNNSTSAGTGASSWVLGESDGAVRYNLITLDFYSPHIGHPTRVLGQYVHRNKANTATVFRSGGMVNTAATAYDSFTFISTGADITGRYYLYAYGE